MARQEGVLIINLMVPKPSTARHRLMIRKIRTKVLKAAKNSEISAIKIAPALNERLRECPKVLECKWKVVSDSRKGIKYNHLNVSL